MNNYGKTAILFDEDGVLVKPGAQVVPEDVQRLLTFFPAMRFVVSGRALGWCWIIATQLVMDPNDRGNRYGVFAENGLVYQFFSDDVRSVVRHSDMGRFQEGYSVASRGGLKSNHSDEWRGISSTHRTREKRSFHLGHKKYRRIG